MRLSKWLNNRKAMAMPGFLAFLIKMTVASSLAFLVFVLKIANVSFFSFILVVYPFIALVIDVILLCCKNKIWHSLPDTALIPEEWQVTKEELLKYAQDVPKIRLMRGVAALFVAPLFLIDSNWQLAEIISSFSISFFICALFDGIFTKIFKLKRAKFLIKESSWKPFRSSIDEINPYVPGSFAWNLESSRRLEETSRRLRDL